MENKKIDKKIGHRYRRFLTMLSQVPEIFDNKNARYFLHFFYVYSKITKENNHKNDKLPEKSIEF